MTFRAAKVLILLMVLASHEAFAQPEFQLRGLLDLRLGLSDDTRSWEERGMGKTRFGGDASGDGRAVARLAEAAAVAQARLAWDLTAVAHLTAGAQQRQAVDVVEAFVAYKPAPTSAVRFRAKAGAFFPPVSLENTSLAWTSPFTISSSAINTWIGEELRTLGAEGTVAMALEGGELSFTAALFGFNDPAGSLLAWRGWAVHDREGGLLEHLPLPRLPSFATTGSAPGQSDAVRAFAELDDRPGYYLGAAWAGDDGLKLRALWYDNRAPARLFIDRQYDWNTRFGSLGAALPLGEDGEFIVQAMAGNTKMADFPTFTVVDADFASVSALASRAWGRHRFAARLEYFEIDDQDFTRDDPNGERGRAATLAYVYRPDDDRRVTLELLNVRSTRAARANIRLPTRANETLIQLSYRRFFSTR
jgi:hypothetical protein